MSTERAAGKPERVSARARKARTRLLNAGFTCLFFLILFFGVAIWQRNETAVVNLKSNLEREFVEPLREAVTGPGGRLPMEFPASAADDLTQGRRFNYPPPEDILILRKADHAVIVGHTQRVPLFFRGDGYCVVLYQRGAPPETVLSVKWWLEEEFCRRIVEQQEWMTARRK